MSSDTPRAGEAEPIWARVELRLRPDDPPVIRGWEIIDTDPPLRFGDVFETEDWDERTATVEVGHLCAVTAGGTRWKPWLVRAFLEATVDGVWLVVGDPERDVLAEQFPIAGALEAQRLIHRARWLRMLDPSLSAPPPVVETYHQWASISEWGLLSTAELFDLFPGPAPIPRRGDTLPAGLAEHIHTAYRLFAELYAQLRGDRLPAVVRRPADAYGGLTLLDMIRTGRTVELAEDLRDSFDYGSSF